MIVFFSITLLWISLAAASAVTGLLIPPLRSPDAPLIAGSRTALVMPIYNEDPGRTTAALFAMAEALAQIDAARHFEIAIISDSTNADAWISESLAVDQLRRDLRETMPVLVPPPLAQHGPQGRQRRGLRPALGRATTS